MVITDVVDEYFTYENRLNSFQNAQQLSKRRASNASTKGPKSMKWPHKWLSPEELAKAGFFYYPILANPDNVACFLCHKNIDGWEKGDDPLAEHLKHSPDCGWAIVATIEKQDGQLSEEYPCSTRMIEARKATFADKWPHEGKKGWKCKVKQMVDAGWKYTPTPEYDDMATCTYCNLALDGWENGDKPLDEHFNRSADCTFFTLINNQKQSPKRTKSKKGRTSKVSRFSTQSAFTVGSDTASLADLPAEEGDSVLTTVTNATVTTQGGRKMGKGKKLVVGKSRKTKAKKDEAVEVVAAPEPEDDDFEVKVDVVSKPTQGRKRKTDETVDLAASVIESQPPAKRRATRTRASTAMDERSIINPDEPVQSVAAKDAPKAKGRKQGGSSIARSTRKASAASVATLEQPIPNDEDIDAALEADLERPLSDDEQSVVPSKKGTRSSKITKADHSMFGIEQMEVDEAAIESELQAMEAESKPLPKAKGAKGKQPRKVSAKQQAAARKAGEAEAEAEAQRAVEEDASRQVAAELEHSLSIHHSSPNVQPKRQRASSRQPSRRLPGRNTRGSVMSVNENTADMTDEFHDAVNDQKDDSGNETDASMASQSTVVRGGSTRRGSTMKNGRGGQKIVSKNIEEIVRKPKDAASEDKHEELPVTVLPDPESIEVDESAVQEEDFYTPAPEATAVVEDPLSKARNSKAAPKGRGRPAKAAPASRTQEIQIELEVEPEVEPKTVQEELTLIRSKTAKGKTVAPRSPTPPPKETTPAESPQSSGAENHPPSSKPSAGANNPTTPHATTTRIPLATSTPMMSPSKRNIIAGLQSAQPWTAVDLDGVFLKSPGDENASGMGLLGEAMQKAKNGDLTSPEKKMTVEQWIHHNAEVAEEKLRGECEAMVGAFEREGGRAMRALEGVECVE